MGKKQKSTNSNSLKRSSNNRPHNNGEDAKDNNNNHSCVQHQRFQSIQLRTIKSSAKNNKQQFWLKYRPTLTISIDRNSSDKAATTTLWKNGDSGILLSHECAIWCCIKLNYTDRNNSTSRGSNNSRQKQSKAGKYALSPRLAEYQLFCDEITKEEEETERRIVARSAGSPINAQSSPSKSSFSFASPPKATSATSPKAQKKQYIEKTVHFIPSRFVPKELLGGDAKSVVLRPIPDPTVQGEKQQGPSVSLLPDDDDTILGLSNASSVKSKNNLSALKSLAKASLNGAMLRKGDLVSIPFRGLPMCFVVAKIKEHYNVDDLSNDMADFSLDEKVKPTIIEGDDERSSLLRSAIQSVFAHKIDYLYSVGIDTIIEIENGEEEDNQAPNNASFGNNKQRVAGIEREIKALRSAIEPALLTPWIFSHDKGEIMRPPRGALLFGPAGVGKSALVEQIGQYFSGLVRRDGEKNHVYVEMEKVECGTLISSVVGESERSLSKLFGRAEMKCKDGISTLIVLDDVELLCPRRGGPIASAASDRSAATLLALMDGIGSEAKRETNESDPGATKSKGNVVVLAITSRPGHLDPALRRPGRLDVEVEISIPDDCARAEIIEMQLECLNLRKGGANQLSSKEIKALARQAKGFTGADTLLAIKEATRNALLLSANFEGNMCLSFEHLQSAIAKTKPSSIRGVTMEVPSVKWDDIGGMQQVKNQLREAIELPVAYPDLYEALCIRPAKGVLLYGPPGCSKTLMARALATEGGMNFLAVKGPELLSKWLGESERALASLFRRARQAAPCVIFFDEVDSIASKRGGGDGGSGGDRLLSQLLTELDGVSPLKRVIVVGATNRPDLLDNALTRPGRIDRMIYVGVPDEDSRKSILEIGLSGKALDADVKISQLATEENTGGFSGAELVGICREAALYAIEEADKIKSHQPMIAMRHLLRSASCIKRQITPEILEFYARFTFQKGGDVTS